MNRIISAVALGLAFITPAYAENTKENTRVKCDISYPVVSGLIARGSMVCNEEWLDRKASLLMVDLTKDCKSVGEQKLSELIYRGMLDFNRKLKELGKTDACMMLDTAMTYIEKTIR